MKLFTFSTLHGVALVAAASLHDAYAVLHQHDQGEGKIYFPQSDETDVHHVGVANAGMSGVILYHPE